MVGSMRLFEGAAHASTYLKFRPVFPQTLFDRILDYQQNKPSAKPFQLALDVGCGPGQSTRPLAPHFDRVVGIDVSKSQITAAQNIENPPNVEYMIGVGEKISMPDASVSLVTCSQAVHWLDFESFCQEVDRVLQPSGCLAIFAHGYCVPETLDGDKTKDKLLQELKLKFYADTMAPYWSSKRRHFENMLADFTIPYADNVREDSFQLIQEVTIPALIGYIRSWSAVQIFLEKHPDLPDPLEEFQESLMQILGVSAPTEDLKIRLTAPIALLLGRKPER